jgi:predicted benzoate:H+ symporter BenE
MRFISVMASGILEGRGVIRGHDFLPTVAMMISVEGLASGS